MSLALEEESLLDGAVDVYVHSSPDIYPRRFDDLGLARCLEESGHRAAVNRHHWSPTAERAELARAATGFDLFGGIVLNGAVGGINPDAVEMVLRSGGVWVSLPSMNARAWRATWHTYDFVIEEQGEDATQVAFDFPAADLVVWEDGELVAGMHEVLGLVKDAGAVLSLGYVGADEQLAVARAARDRGIGAVVVTNPRRLADEELAPLLELDNVFLEITCPWMGMFQMDPPGPSPTGAQIDAELIRRIGVDRCVLSTSGGMAGEVAPPTDLVWGCRSLALQGITMPELRALVQTTPARLLKLE